jgi:hypothetical protein
MGKRKSRAGRKTKMDKTTVQKLEDAFANAFPDDEACLYAGIDRSTLYNYQKKHPKFVDRKEQLKLSPNLVARKTIVGQLGTVNVAQWWLEKKDPGLRPSSKVEHTGEIEIQGAITERSPEEIAALKALREARIKRIQDSSDKME